MRISSPRHCGVIIVMFVAATGSTPAWAGTHTKIAQETAEYLLQTFGKQAVREGSQTLARKIEIYAARHGDDFVRAVKQVGPRTFHLVEEAGVNGGKAVQVLARHGEHGAIYVLARPKGLQLFLQHGDDAAAALVKHKGIAEPVIERLGQPAIKALQSASPQSGRRLAIMVESGEWAKFGRHDELLEIIARYGDRAMTFVWDHKGALATTAGLAAFLANPEAFINGARDLTQIVGANVVRPVIEAPFAIATEVARGTNWTVLILFFGSAGLLFLAVQNGGLGGWCKQKGKRLWEEANKPDTCFATIGKRLAVLRRWFGER